MGQIVAWLLPFCCWTTLNLDINDGLICLISSAMVKPAGCPGSGKKSGKNEIFRGQGTLTPVRVYLVKSLGKVREFWKTGL